MFHPQLELISTDIDLIDLMIETFLHMIVRITMTAMIRDVIMIYQLYPAVIAVFIEVLELEKKNFSKFLLLK